MCQAHAHRAIVGITVVRLEEKGSPFYKYLNRSSVRPIDCLNPQG